MNSSIKLNSQQRYWEAQQTVTILLPVLSYTDAENLSEVPTKLGGNPTHDADRSGAIGREQESFVADPDRSGELDRGRYFHADCARGHQCRDRGRVLV